MRLHKPKWLVLWQDQSLGGGLSAESARGPQEERIQSSSYLIMRVADPWVHGFILPQRWLASKLRWVPLIDLKPFEVAVKRQRQWQKEGRSGEGREGVAEGMKRRKRGGRKREGDREWDVSREQGVQAERGNEGWKGARHGRMAEGWAGRGGGDAGVSPGTALYCTTSTQLRPHQWGALRHTHTHTQVHTGKKSILLLLELSQYQGSRAVDVFA